MGGYERFKVGSGPNAKYVWADSLAEAEARCRFDEARRLPAQPGPNDPWDVFLIGHGFSLKNYVRPNRRAPRPRALTLSVPQGITVLFYCPDHATDSLACFCDLRHEEFATGRHMIEAAAPLVANRQAPAAPQDLPAAAPNSLQAALQRGRNRLGAGRAQQPAPLARPPHADAVSVVGRVDADTDPPEAEHILTFPSLRTAFKLSEMVQATKADYAPGMVDRVDANPDRAGIQLHGHPAHRSAIYVGNPLQFGEPNEFYLRGNYAYLSDLLDAIAGQHTPTRVHWVACRDALTANKLDAFYAETVSRFGARSTEGVHLPHPLDEMLAERD